MNKMNSKQNPGKGETEDEILLISNTSTVAFVFDYNEALFYPRYKMIYLLGWWLANPIWAFWLTFSMLTDCKVQLGVIDKQTDQVWLIRLKKHDGRTSKKKNI